MKKPWRFTPKQVRKPSSRRFVNKHRNSFKDYCGYHWSMVKTHNARQLWLETHNWIDDGLYRNHHKNSAAWLWW